jgi:hypothetical protein
VPAHQVILIRPARFGSNPQTAESNAFQQPAATLNLAVIEAKALREFAALTGALENAGVDILIFDDTCEPHTPDSIFPNNWFSTHPYGTLCLYPMMAENRRPERRADIIAALRERFDVRRIVDLTAAENEGRFLEGTGSLVLDQPNKIAYACLSPRTDAGLLNDWAKQMDFQPVSFSALDATAQAIYHTNVMMCVGDKFAVVCLESVSDNAERAALRTSLEQSGKEIVEISLEQMTSFAGNMLQLSNGSGGSILMMSQQAFDSLRQEQVDALAKYARLIAVDISTIETCGGGSVRCMIAENFLPAKMAAK